MSYSTVKVLASKLMNLRREGYQLVSDLIDDYREELSDDEIEQAISLARSLSSSNEYTLLLKKANEYMLTKSEIKETTVKFSPKTK
jgi:hypothetical protein